MNGGRVMRRIISFLIGMVLNARRPASVSCFTLLPPHHEVGGRRAERRHEDQFGGKNRISAAHISTSPIDLTASVFLASGAWQR
jgi:hypothetical protein